MTRSKEINEAIVLLTNHVNHLCANNLVFYENKEEQSLFKIDHIEKTISYKHKTSLFDGDILCG